MGIIFDESFISADVPIETAEDQRVILEAGLRNAVEELETNPDDQNAKSIFLVAFIGYCYSLQATTGMTYEQAKSKTLEITNAFKEGCAERGDNANPHPLIEIEKRDSSR